MRRLGMCAAGFATLLFAGAASADGLDGAKGSIIISGERLFGLGIESIKVDGPNDSYGKDKQTSFTLLWGKSGITPYTIPRAAFDYAVIDSLTIGGSLGLASVSPSTETKAGSTTTNTDGASTFYFALAPRVGYIIPVAESFSIWPRAGITYWHASTDDKAANNNNGVTTTQSGLSLDVDVMFSYSVAKNFAIGVAPELNLGFSGSNDAKADNGGATVSNDLTATHFGAHFAVMGVF